MKSNKAGMNEVPARWDKGSMIMGHVTKLEVEISIKGQYLFDISYMDGFLHPDNTFCMMSLYLWGRYILVRIFYKHTLTVKSSCRDDFRLD